MALYGDIIIDISHEAVDRVFQYEIPDHLQEKIHIGVSVFVPFGSGNHLRKGYVVGIGTIPSFDPDKIKAIYAIDDNQTTTESVFIQLAGWMKEQYGGTMIQALKTVLPVKDKIKEKEERTLQLLLSKEDGEEKRLLYEKKHYKAKERLLYSLLKYGKIPYEYAIKTLKVSRDTIISLEKEEVLAILTKQKHRDPISYLEKEIEEQKVLLNEEQQNVISRFWDNYQNGIQKTYLLHGITGSGKTEVYIEIIEKVVKQGKEAIVLIPEISLTHQTVTRFIKRFGNQVTILNSRMSKGERYDQFVRAKNGEISVVIGPRSALFMPFQRLGLILIDEEHELSYKSETVPKYHARETAIERAKMAEASVVLGSATPSLESYTKAKLGEYELLELKHRAKKDAMLPTVEIVDLRQELLDGNRSMFSRLFQEKMKERLEKGEQVMIFLNRRGYSNFISCRQCGEVMVCPHCDVSLTYHRDGKLRCHYCGYVRETPKLCPKCDSRYIGAFGIGTQKVEEAVKTMFPMSRVVRMDTDTTKGKDGFYQILQQFSSGEANVLIGTQMIVKGHDFPKVTLVGILAADLSLNSNDYRSSERTFQLLTQAAGRAGRGTQKGEVVIQTYQPKHYSIVTAQMQNYEAFYHQEIAFRNLMKYPPVYQMLTVFFAAKDENIVIKAGEAIKAAMLEYKESEQEDYILIGPSEASLKKLQDLYRRVLYIKHIDYKMLVNCKNFLEGYYHYSAIFKEVQIQFDFNSLVVY